MRYRSSSDVWTIIGLAVFFIWLILAVSQKASISRTCLLAGFPSSATDWRMNGFCIKRVDQTDVVVPVESIGVR